MAEQDKNTGRYRVRWLTGGQRKRGAVALGLLLHAVGPDGQRNYYAESPESCEDWEMLCALRLAVRGREIPGGLRCYHVSVPGVAMLRALYPRRYSRGLVGAPFTAPPEQGDKSDA